MNVFLIFLALLAGGGALAYLRAPLSIATAAGAVGLLILSQLAQGALAWLIMLLAWLIWALLLALNSATLRQRYLSGPLCEVAREALPPISRTEQEAIEAGSVWWDAELFSGAPQWGRLLEMRAGTLSAAERAFLDGPVNELCAMADEWTISRELGDLPPAVWAFMKAGGFFGVMIPQRYGGLGFSALAQSEIMLKLGSRSATVAATCMVPNALGPAELLLHYGTETQKEHYLPRLARGEEIPCFALTNPYAGSDAAAIPDSGVVCEGEFEGRKVLGIHASWEKRYITLAPVATLIGLALRVYDPDHLLGEQTDVGITLALVPAGHPGVTSGRRHFPARQAFQNGPIQGENVFIPMDWVIGGQARCGQGWRMLMACLAAGRAISLPASSAAAMKLCTYTASVYTRLRTQFGLPIARFEGVQEALARIAANTYLVDAARRVTVAAIDSGEAPAVISALLKYQATERMRAAINDTMDVHGGRAICDGPANYLFQAYMAAPVAITVEGANVLTRSLMVFGQGALRCHPWLLEEIRALAEPDPDVSLERFDRALRGHAAHVLSNFARAALRNLTGGVLGSDPSVGEVNYWYAKIESASASFALLADGAIAQLGGAFKRREMISGRFADALGELYLLSAALKHFEDGGRASNELPLIEYVMRSGLCRIEQAFDEILRNLPRRGLAWLLRRALFPWGRRQAPPPHALVRELATGMCEDAVLLERLTVGIYRADDVADPIGRLEHARSLAASSEELLKRLRAAQKSGAVAAWADDPVAAAERAGLVDATEAARLRECERAVRKAIDVDDFAAAELWPPRG